MIFGEEYKQINKIKSSQRFDTLVAFNDQLLLPLSEELDVVEFSVVS